MQPALTTGAAGAAAWRTVGRLWAHKVLRRRKGLRRLLKVVTGKNGTKMLRCLLWFLFNSPSPCLGCTYYDWLCTSMALRHTGATLNDVLAFVATVAAFIKFFSKAIIRPARHKV